MSSVLQRLALAGAAVLLLPSCGDSDEADDSVTPDAAASSSESSAAPSTDAPESPTSKSEPSEEPGEPEDAGEQVVKARFCPDIDPEQVGGLLGLDGLGVITDAEPGDGTQYWTCTIGQTAGTSVGVTFNVLDAPAQPSDVAAMLANFTGTLGPKNCTDVGDEALGPGTRGVDCSGTSSGTGFTMVARAAVVGDTQIECLLASYSQDDLSNLRAGAPQVCALFRDRVVR